MDGLKQHNIDHETMKIYEDNKIILVTEEADTSHVNQVYDQDPAKSDKRIMRQALALIREHSSMIQRAANSWDLVHVGLSAVRECPDTAWRDSAIRVNLHPHQRVPFSEWCDRISQFLQVLSPL